MSSVVIAVATEVVVVFLHQEAAEVEVEGWNEAVIAVETEVVVPLHLLEVAEVEDCYEAAVAAVVLLELRHLEMMRQELKNRTRVVCTLLHLRCCRRSSGDDSSLMDRPFAFFPEPKHQTQRRI